MAITLNNTLSDQFANSYVDLAYANAYWADDFRAGTSAAWSALSDNQKAKLLIAACASIERIRFTIPWQVSTQPVAYDPTSQTVRVYALGSHPYKWNAWQSLQFPRSLDINLSGPGMGQAFIPEPVLQAQCEQAMYLLTLDDSDLSAQLQGIRRQSVTLGQGDVQLDTQYAGSGVDLAPRALSLLAKYMVKSGKLMRS